MRYGYQHAAFHLLKSIALYAIGFGVLFAFFLTAMEMPAAAEMTAQEAETVGLVFDALGVGALAIFVWANIEFAAAVWSISYVRRAAGWARSRIREVAD